MAVSADLQRQCHELLSQLKTNQLTLRQGLASDIQPSSLDNNLQARLTEKKPEYARQKLKSIMRQKNNDTSHISGTSRTMPVHENGEWNTGFRHPEKMVTTESLQQKKSQETGCQERLRLDKSETKRPRLMQGEKEGHELAVADAMQDYFESRTTNSLMDGGTDSILGPVSTEDNTRPQPIAKPTTPTSVRRRRIIDRNVHVDSRLSEADLCELEKDVRGLNFSYSQQLDEDTLKKGRLEEQDDVNQNSSSPAEDRAEDPSLTYHRSLLDTGNNRQLNNFIKDTTIKPKTILNSTQSFSSNYSKQGPGVSFESAASTSVGSGTSALFRSQAKERRMLGYDWIAALISNDAGLMDESESYFHELREFRRCNRDECCNDFYMEGPFTLTETEPPAVEKALNERKVQPFTVNERLFTVPVTENLLGEPLDTGYKAGRKTEPTQDNPRFVRVSIPRSTLQMPYKVRPHRRRSFDASDSCSLTEHCLMGWNAVSPATLPTASSISLTDAMTGVNPKHATTMAAAEKAASTFHWPLLTDPRPNPDSLPTWRRQYMDTTLNFPLPESPSLSLSSSLGGSRGSAAPSGSLRRKTDELLDSTYSMMYEMQRAREQREVERAKEIGKAAS